MTEIIKAIVLGAIEGLTEFLPVSSTGHLILIGKSIHFAGGQTATFDIAIQLGAIFAVVVAYFPLFKELLTPKKWLTPTWISVSISTIPALIMGVLLHHIIKTKLFNPYSVAVALVVGGVLMIIVEKWVKPKPKTFEIEQITKKQALVVGISQCAALWPGMSRSASSIMGGLLCGLDEQVAAKYSFIIAVPIMVAAVGYDLLKSWNGLTFDDFGHILIGFSIAFLIAWASLRFMLSILRKYRLLPFALYRLILGGFLLYVFM